MKTNGPEADRQSPGAAIDARGNANYLGGDFVGGFIASLDDLEPQGETRHL